MKTNYFYSGLLLFSALIIFSCSSPSNFINDKNTPINQNSNFEGVIIFENNDELNQAKSECDIVNIKYDSAVVFDPEESVNKYKLILLKDIFLDEKLINLNQTKSTANIQSGISLSFFDRRSIYTGYGVQAIPLNGVCCFHDTAYTWFGVFPTIKTYSLLFGVPNIIVEKGNFHKDTCFGFVFGG
jgi:hypothetical protein